MVTSICRILRHKQFEENRLREFEEALNREAVSWTVVECVILQELYAIFLRLHVIPGVHKYIHTNFNPSPHCPSS